MSPRLIASNNIQLQLDSTVLPQDGTIITRKMLEKILESTDKSWLHQSHNKEDDSKLTAKKVQMDVILTQT